MYKIVTTNKWDILRINGEMEVVAEFAKDPDWAKKYLVDFEQRYLVKLEKLVQKYLITMIQKYLDKS